MVAYEAVLIAPELIESAAVSLRFLSPIEGRSRDRLTLFLEENDYALGSDRGKVTVGYQSLSRRLARLAVDETLHGDRVFVPVL